MVNKLRSPWPWIVGGTVLLLVVVIAVVHSSTTPPTVTAPQVPAPAPTPGQVARQPILPTGPLTSFGDGTYQVGTAAGDVTAGFYRSTGSTEGMPCYWARSKDATGNVDAIIADGYPSGPTTVPIKSSDAVFLASGCAPWHKVG